MASFLLFSFGLVVALFPWCGESKVFQIMNLSSTEMVNYTSADYSDNGFRDYETNAQRTPPTISSNLEAARIYESFRITPQSATEDEMDGYNDGYATTMQSTDVYGGNEESTTNSTSSRKMRTTSNDYLIKNISIILENLLKSYERSQLPTHGKEVVFGILFLQVMALLRAVLFWKKFGNLERTLIYWVFGRGVPTLVKTNMLIRSMGPVSELDMDYSMDCYFRQYWRDKRLSFKGPIQSLSLSIKMLDKIWRPDTYFYNGKHSHIHTITVPNKLLRLSQDGDILYSMRLTIKATCPMHLTSFPMDYQSCPLVIGSYTYTTKQLLYEWQNTNPVSFVPGMTLNQFDLMSIPYKNYTYNRREGDFSVLHVSFHLKRHTGYFLIQVYVPCILIVVLSWVSFWIHREATSDRVGLCVTAVLTLSTISLDSRTDLPKVKYATALDWFLLMSFLYCIATLLEFAGVHYFTKVGSGEILMSEDEWEDIEEMIESAGVCTTIRYSTPGTDSPQYSSGSFRRRNSLICPIYNDPTQVFRESSSRASTMERTTQTEPPAISKWKQMWLCFIGDLKFRKQREKEAATSGQRHINSVSMIDQVSRVAFPVSFGLFNLLYWLAYAVLYRRELP